MKGISFVISPIIMRILSVQEYGLLSLLTNFIEVLFTCFGLGLRQLLTIEYYHNDLINRKKLINEILVVYCILMVPITVFLILGSGFINEFIFEFKANNLIIIFSLLVAFLRVFADIFYQVLQFLQESLKFVIIQIIAAILIFSLNLFFLYYFALGVFSTVIAQFIGVSVVILISLYYYFRNSYHLNLNLSCAISKTGWYLKRGLPFVPRLLFSWILAVGDRWVLAKYANFESVGIYSVADMFGQLFQLIFILPFTYAYIPYMLQKFTQNKDKVFELDKKNLKIMSLVMLVLIVLLFVLFKPFILLFSPLICKVITPKYMCSLDYVFGLLLGYIFLLGSYFSSVFLQYQKRVYFILFSITLPAILNIFLNIFLVPRFGISGCVYATLISYIFYFLITLFYNFYAKRVNVK